MTESATALLTLAALLKSGYSLRQALLAWPDELTGPLEAEARQLVRRLEVGHSIQDAVEVSSLAWLLLPAFSVHLATGADLVAWLERVAADRQETAAAIGAARSAVAGAALSGRMVAGLPLLFVPLTPMARAPLTDPIGMGMLTIGITLTIIGLRWIGRLLPRPSEEDAVADLCVSLSAMLRAGLSVHSSLDLAARHPSASASLIRARNLVRLGSSWPDALSVAGDDGPPIAASIRRAQRFGIPLADGLDALSRARREAQKRAFEQRMKRAPVLMVVPLTCCILPAYGLLALGPFLRSMSVS